MAGRALTIDITTKDQQTLAALKRIQRELGQLDKSIDQTAKQSNKLGEGADEYARKLSQAREVAGGIVLGGTVAALGLSTKAAGDLAEAQAKTNSVFKESVGVIDEFAAGATEGLALSKREALESASTFGNLFTQLDMGTATAAEMSTSMITLAGDFAAFHNANPVDVIEAQTAAFRGEYDALQKFVPTINAAAVEQRAMADTGKANSKELTAQEKALATYNIMLDNAGDAQGAAARESDGLAMSTKRAKAELENSAATIGEALVPVVAKGAAGVATLAEAFGNLPGPVQTGIVGIGGLTLGVGLLAPKLIEGGKVMAVAASRAADMAAKLVLPKSALDGLGSATDATTPKIGKFGVALGAIGAAAAAYELIQLGRAMGETKVSAEDALRATTEELEQLVIGMEGIASQKDFEAFGRQNIDSLYAMRDAAQDAGIPYPKLAAAIDAVEQGNATAAARTEEYAGAAEGAAGAATDLAAGTNKAATAAERQAKASQDAASAVDGLRSAQDGVTSAQDGVASALDQVADAEDGVADARKGVADTSRGVQDAEESLSDARTDAADAVADLVEAERQQREGSEELEDANKGVMDAEKALTEAQKDSKAAQEDLTQAREDAAEALDDMAVSARSAVLDEKEAVLDLAEAKRALAAGPDLDEAKADESPEQAAEREKRNAEARAEWARDRERLGIRVERAEIRLAEAQEANQEAAEGLADAQAKGIEQSDIMAEARDKVALAAEGERTAEEGLKDAKVRVTEVQEELALRVVEAQARVQEANDRVKAAADGVRDAVGQVGEAQQRVVDATEGVVEARGAVAEAEDKVTEALVAQAIAQEELDTALGNNQTVLDDQIAKLLELAGQMEPGSPVRARLMEMAEQLNGLTSRPWTIELQTAISAVEGAQETTQALVDAIVAATGGGRATGGSIGAGQKRVVGENGPEVVEGPAEVLTPEQVAARDRQAAAFAERSSRRQESKTQAVRDVHFNVTVAEAGDPWATGDAVARQVMRAMQVGPAH